MNIGHITEKKFLLRIHLGMLRKDIHLDFLSYYHLGHLFHFYEDPLTTFTYHKIFQEVTLRFLVTDKDMSAKLLLKH